MKDSKEWRALVHMYVIEFRAASFCLAPVLFLNTLSRSGGIPPHMKRGGMPLHDAARVNFKRGTTTEYQDSDA